MNLDNQKSPPPPAKGKQEAKKGQNKKKRGAFNFSKNSFTCLKDKKGHNFLAVAFTLLTASFLSYQINKNTPTHTPTHTYKANKRNKKKTKNIG